MIAWGQYSMRMQSLLSPAWKSSAAIPPLLTPQNFSGSEGYVSGAINHSDHFHETTQGGMYLPGGQSPTLAHSSDPPLREAATSSIRLAKVPPFNWERQLD